MTGSTGGFADPNICIEVRLVPPSPSLPPAADSPGVDADGRQSHPVAAAASAATAAAAADDDVAAVSLWPSARR